MIRVKKYRGSWYVDGSVKLPDGTRSERIRHRAPGRTRRDAEEYARKVEAQIAAGTYTGSANKADGDTLAELAPRWLAARRSAWTPSTFTSYESKWRNHIAPRLGKCRVQTIRERDGVALITELEAAGLKAGTIRPTVSALKSLLEYARSCGLIREVPRIKTPPQSAPRERYLTPDEARTLIETLYPPQWGAMARWCLATGCRLGEALALRWEDISADRTTVVIRRQIIHVTQQEGPPKSKRPRVLPLGDDARLALEDQESERLGPYVWHPDDSPEHYHTYTAQCAMEAAREQLGLHDVSWHTLRHTYASWLAQADVSIQKIRDLLGHGSITTTMRYAHLRPGAHHDAAAKLPKI